jgi:hypothetical protein
MLFVNNLRIAEVQSEVGEAEKPVILMMGMISLGIVLSSGII